MGLLQAHTNNALPESSRTSARRTRRRPTLYTRLLILVLSAAANGLSQTTWFKYEGNPVLDVGPPGTWEVAEVTPARVLAEGTIYKMWYTGFDGAGHPQTGYATSRNGIAWIKHNGNPAVRRMPLTWEGAGFAHAFVIRDKAGYHMWYTGGDTLRVLQIGYATSPDGIRWTRASSQVNPVVRNGPPGSWTSQGVSGSSVLGPDSAGTYKMWFSGDDENQRVKIGYATGADATTWARVPDPVLGAGEPGSWDDGHVCFPRVLFHDSMYEMWYTGCREYPDRRVGYARSTDGMHWERAPENPVLVPGPKGSWDGALVKHPEILFDGKVYHMWYAGNNHPREEARPWSIGYAISPAGSVVSVSPVAVPSGMPVRIELRMNDHLSMSLTAELFSEQGELADSVELPDDGRHGDDAATDGCFSNSWFPRNEASYSVDLLLKHHNRAFRLRNAAVFTSVGPVVCPGSTLADNAVPHPGDTLLVRPVLRNHGRVAAARDVEASLAASDSSAVILTPGPLSYGSIDPDSEAESRGYYRVVIDSDCPAHREVTLNLKISSRGIPYWTDSIVLRVLPPWWRTQWAFALYALAFVGSVLGAVRFVGTRKLKRGIRQLEQDHALEHERMRISQDMHDEVGARLTEIGILGELAKREIHSPGKTLAEIEKITETSREVIESISQIIWAMNVRNDALDNLVAYLHEYALNYLGPTAIACRFEIPGEIPGLTISAEARRNIFLVIKEALHNVVKHSGATETEIRVSFSPDRFEMAVRDNGKGFDAAQSSRFGNGLRNMSKRMSDIEGGFEVCSAPGQGTTVRLSAKLGSRG